MRHLIFTPMLALSACAEVGVAPAAGQAGPPPGGYADKVIVGPAYTLDPAQPWAEAVAERGGALVHVGSEAGAAAWIGPNTRVKRLTGDQTLLPGLHDVHTHLLEAFHPAVSCLLNPGSTPNGYANQASWCRPSSGTGWVLGWGWDMADVEFAPYAPRTYLDAWFPNTPVALMETTSHAVWVNSEGLRRLGMNPSTPDPTGGLIIRDPSTGVPTGLLLDAAGELAFDFALRPNPTLRRQNERALRDGLAYANRHGLTSIGDARAYWKRGHVDAWEAVAASGDLTVRAVVGLWAYADMDVAALVPALTSMYRDTPGDLLRISNVKVYSDGIVHNTTAALLEPYTTSTWGDPLGLTYFNTSRLQQLAEGLAPVGFDLHIHAIGDRGVRQALDALQAATPPARPPRHRLTHVELVHPDDLPRFAALDVAADMQMYDEAMPNQLHDADPFLGAARVDERAFRLRDLWDSGARIVLSSDYDVGDISPFVGMARALNRGAQSLPSVDAALRAYTIDAAWVLRQEHLVGSLEVGKRADLVIVDRNPLTTTDLEHTQVAATIVDGRVVYRHPAF